MCFSKGEDVTVAGISLTQKLGRGVLGSCLPTDRLGFAKVVWHKARKSLHIITVNMNLSTRLSPSVCPWY